MVDGVEMSGKHFSAHEHAYKNQSEYDLKDTGAKTCKYVGDEIEQD